MGRQSLSWYDLGAPLDLPNAEKLLGKGQVDGRRIVQPRLSASAIFFKDK